MFGEKGTCVIACVCLCKQLAQSCYMKAWESNPTWSWLVTTMPHNVMLQWLNTTIKTTDCMKYTIKLNNLTLPEAVDMAHNRPLWRLLCNLKSCMPETMVTSTTLLKKTIVTTYISFPSAGPFFSTSDTTTAVSPLGKCGLSRPPLTAIPNP